MQENPSYRCRRLKKKNKFYKLCYKLTFDLLALKVVSKSRVTWATSVPILLSLGLSVLDLGPMYATDMYGMVWYSRV